MSSIQADTIAGGGDLNESKVNKIYSLCSIREINGTKVNPLKNHLEFADVAQRFSMGDLMKLMLEFGKITSASMSDDLKNELSSLASDS